jgi:hypothetical protein
MVFRFPDTMKKSVGFILRQKSLAEKDFFLLGLCCELAFQVPG